MSILTRLAHHLHLATRDYLRSRGETPGIWGERRELYDRCHQAYAQGRTSEARALLDTLKLDPTGIEADLVRLELLVRRKESLAT